MRQGCVPERGDVIWLSFSPQAGREQFGRRPGVVLSPARFNRRIGLALTGRTPPHVLAEILARLQPLLGP